MNRINSQSVVASKVNLFEAMLDSKLTELDNGDYAILVVDYKNLKFQYESDCLYICDMDIKSYQDAKKITEYQASDRADIKAYFIDNANHYYTYGSMPW